MTLQLRRSIHPEDFDHLVDEAMLAAPRTRLYRDFFKRVIDILLVTIVAVPAIIILLILCGCIALDGRSPIYRQKRVGRSGRTFMMVKLRSMVTDADVLLASHLQTNQSARTEWNRTQKLRRDPRITPIGRLIRKTSLDELPQLWNVIRGDMSLVGPRPMMPEQQKLYPGSAYYVLRPGITGFWQTSVRNDSSFAERASFDTEYLSKMSFVTDLVVLVRTIRVVLRGTGW